MCEPVCVELADQKPVGMQLVSLVYNRLLCEQLAVAGEQNRERPDKIISLSKQAIALQLFGLIRLALELTACVWPNGCIQSAELAYTCALASSAGRLARSHRLNSFPSSARKNSVCQIVNWNSVK